MPMNDQVALRKLVEAIEAFLEAESKTYRVLPERMRKAYLDARSVLARSEDLEPQGNAGWDYEKE